MLNIKSGTSMNQPDSLEGTVGISSASDFPKDLIRPAQFFDRGPQWFEGDIYAFPRTPNVSEIGTARPSYPRVA